MKKTLISLVLVFALLSTCVFSAVFAAYSASSGKQTFTATVSAFGIETVTVNENAAVDVNILPGQNGVLAKTTVTGNPKVNAALGYKVDFSLVGNWTTDGKVLDTSNAKTNAEYFPIQFTVTHPDTGAETTYGIGGTSQGTYVACTNFENLASTIKTAMEAASFSKTFTANQALTDANAYAAKPVISWNWVPGTYDNSLDSNCKFIVNVTATVTQVG